MQMESDDSIPVMDLANQEYQVCPVCVVEYICCMSFADEYFNNLHVRDPFFLSFCSGHEVDFFWF